MALQTITSAVGTTSHYVFTPQSVQSVSGLGLEASQIVRGWTNANAFGTASSISVELDDAFLWDVDISFRLAAPVKFEGLNVSSGGDLFELLNAQGWTPL